MDFPAPTDTLTDPLALLVIGHPTGPEDYSISQDTERDGHHAWLPYGLGSTVPVIDNEGFTSAGSSAELDNIHQQQQMPNEPMDSVKRTRKGKATTLKDADWEPHKDLIIDLYVSQQLPLPRVLEHMKREHGFEAK